MAKRFTATEKWQDPWFCSLTTQDKLFWLYLLDNCNHAGIWQVNWPLVKFHIKGYRFNPATFEGRIKSVNHSKWYISKFVDFQYGNLNPSNRAHQSVLSLIEKEGASKGLASSLLGAMDKDKDKDKVKVKYKDKDNVYNDIIYDLNNVLGASFKPASAKTRSLIHTRLGEGFTQDDFKAVHRQMKKEWGMDEKMSAYLRPETLYSNKFEGYLQRAKKSTPKSTGAIDEIKGWEGKKKISPEQMAELKKMVSKI